MRKSTIILVIALLGLPAISGAAGFAKVGAYAYNWEGFFTGSRLSALGGADMADGGTASVLINPAPLASGDRVAAGYDRANYIDGHFRTIAGFASLKGWRFSLAVSDFLVDPVMVRTAYHPEGTGETFETKDRMTVMGLSRGSRARVFGQTFAWSVGAAYRKFSNTLEINGNDSSSLPDRDSLDLGATLGWRRDISGGWIQVTGAISWQNATAAKVDIEGRQASLPRPLRTGLTTEMGFTRQGRDDNLFRLLAAYTRTSELVDGGSDDSTQWGLEAVVFDALALRYGKNTAVLGDIDSWGVGLILDHRVLGPFTVEADLGGMKYDFSEDEKTAWGIRASYAY